MQNFHAKLTQKYQIYNQWHQTKHHNKIHWGVFIVFSFFVSTLLLNPLELNLKKDNNNNNFLSDIVIQKKEAKAANGTFGPQSSNKNIEWGFDFVETFDGLQDWKGTILNDDVMVWKNGSSNFPKHLDGSDSNWEFYSCWKPLAGNNWIANHGPENVWGGTGKSAIIDLSNNGWGPNGFGLYFGDGTPESGYDDIYVFHMMRIPKNQWPTYIDPGNSVGTYTEGQDYAYFWSWKSGVINLGMDDTHKYNGSQNVYSPFHIISHIKPEYAGAFGKKMSMVLEPYDDPNRYSYWATEKAVHDFLPGWWGVEYHFRNQNNVTYMDVWIYDANGNSWQIINNRQVSYTTQPASHKWNDWFFGVNNSSTYKWGPTMNSTYYIDDFIINGSRIGPKYFSLLNDQPPPSDTTPPTTPTNPTATPVSSSQINLSWIASTDDMGVTGYKIYRCAGSTCAPTTQIATSATNSYSDTGLTASTTYTYTVSAYDAAGNESDASSPVSVTTLNYPKSQVIESITWGAASIVRKAPGSDNWPMTWADDDHQYTSWGDGGGFGGVDAGIGVAKVEGAPESFQGANLWSGPRGTDQWGGKSYGILSVDNVLYMWVGQGGDNSEGAWQTSKIFWSVDHGVNWQQTSWKFDNAGKDDGFSWPSFLNFGKNYSGARDTFVYAYGVDFDGNNRTKVSLARVPKDKILERASYEFFKGLDIQNNALWTPDITQRQSVFSDSNGIAVAAVSYNSGISRYLLVGTHNNPAAPFGGLGVFDAPEPWGPWTTVEYTNNWQGDTTMFFANIPTKWISADGKTFYMVFTGFGNGIAQDAYQHIKGTLTTPEADTTPPTLTSVNTLSPTQLVVTFSEPVEEASATAAANYTIDKGITISIASLGSDLKTVTLTTSPHQEGIIYTLTVNNIKDRATVPNTIALNSKASYTYTPKIAIANLNAASGKAYEVVENGLQLGALAYIDRTYTYTTIPAWLLGTTYIKTANDDKASTDTGFLSFSINQDATVYVAHDNVVTAKPAWLSSFTDTGDDIATSDTTFSLFMKDFAQGQVSLGGNEGAGGSMYTVIIKGKGTQTTYKKSDLNEDTKVDQLDFDILKQDFNRTDKPKSDLNQDGIVDSRDLGIMMSEWSK